VLLNDQFDLTEAADWNSISACAEAQESFLLINA
jgi:hypothetical protein